MEIKDQSWPAREKKEGVVSFVLPAGKTLKVETVPSGEEILNWESPDEDPWTVRLTVVMTKD